MSIWVFKVWSGIFFLHAFQNDRGTSKETPSILHWGPSRIPWVLGRAYVSIWGKERKSVRDGPNAAGAVDWFSVLNVSLKNLLGGNRTAGTSLGQLVLLYGMHHDVWVWLSVLSLPSADLDANGDSQGWLVWLERQVVLVCARWCHCRRLCLTPLFALARLPSAGRASCVPGRGPAFPWVPGAPCALLSSDTAVVTYVLRESMCLALCTLFLLPSVCKPQGAAFNSSVYPNKTRLCLPLCIDMWINAWREVRGDVQQTKDSSYCFEVPFETRV